MNLMRFNAYLKHAMLVMAMLTIVGISGCDDDEEPAPTKTIWELVDANADLTMLKEQLTNADLETQLSGTGTFTLFAPSNAAMTNLLATLGLTNFNSVSEQVTKAVLAYHVANSQYLSAALTTGAEITTLQGEKIKVIVTSTGEKTLDTGATSDSKVTTADIKATNGVIHIVDVVLVPPTIGQLIVSTIGTVVQPILLGADFTILAAGLQKADAFATGAGVPTLTSILLNEATGTENYLYTVFAPTNATFNAATPAPITAATFTGEQWYGIISHHVVASDETYGSAADFTAGGTFNTLLTANTGGAKKLKVLATAAPTDPAKGIMTGIVLDSNGDTTPNAQIAVLDVLTATGATPAGNGIINVIAGVLSPN